MNKNAKKWLKALLSDEYKQGKGFLCQRGESFNKFCCLGVACDLYQQEIGDLEILEMANHKDILYYDEERCELPSKVQNWLGLKSYEGEYNSNSLIDDNDQGKTFPEIVEIIKEYEEELFV